MNPNCKKKNGRKIKWAKCTKKVGRKYQKEIDFSAIFSIIIVNRKGVGKVGKMIEVAGFKAFRGSMQIRPNGGRAFVVYGDWLYRPETKCWYSGAASYPAEICWISEIE